MDQELEKLRKEIDETDKKIVALIEKRVEIARKIGSLKRENGIPVSDAAREKEVLDNVSKSAGRDKGFVKSLYRSIIEYCKNEE